MKSLPNLPAGPSSEKSEFFREQPLEKLRIKGRAKRAKKLKTGVNRTGVNTRRKNFGRYPEVLIGISLILAGVVFSLAISSTNDSQPQTSIAVLSSSLQKDEILMAEHLATVEVDLDSAFRFLNQANARRLLGQKALLNLPADSPVLEEYFSHSPLLMPGQVLAGLKLGVGQYPAAHLRTGDLVDVVVVEGNAAKVLLEKAEVYASVRLNESAGADMFVTLVIPYLEELSLATAAENAGLRLFLNPASGRTL